MSHYKILFLTFLQFDVIELSIFHLSDPSLWLTYCDCIFAVFQSFNSNIVCIFCYILNHDLSTNLIFNIIRRWGVWHFGHIHFGTVIVYVRKFHIHWFTVNFGFISVVPKWAMSQIIIIVVILTERYRLKDNLDCELNLFSSALVSENTKRNIASALAISHHLWGYFIDWIFFGFTLLWVYQSRWSLYYYIIFLICHFAYEILVTLFVGEANGNSFFLINYLVEECFDRIIAGLSDSFDSQRASVIDDKGHV